MPNTPVLYEYSTIALSCDVYTLECSVLQEMEDSVNDDIQSAATATLSLADNSLDPVVMLERLDVKRLVFCLDFYTQRWVLVVAVCYTKDIWYIICYILCVSVHLLCIEYTLCPKKMDHQLGLD